MPGVRFETTIPAFERAKTVHALDRAATVIGINVTRQFKFVTWHDHKYDTYRPTCCSINL
jgi:hypothetical protein